MMFRLLFSLLLLCSSPLFAEVDPEAAFKKANQAMEAGRHQEALEAYRQVLAIQRSSGVLWNAGMAAYLLDLPEEAKTYWKELKAAEPEDFAVRAKLVQVYQALGDKTNRDAERIALKTLWSRAPKDSDLGRQTEFCRDQFMAAGHRVFAMEQFAFEDPYAVLYVFRSPENPAQKDRWLSLGSYQGTNDLMREADQLGPGQRAFHLDGYDRQNQHWTYDFYRGEPGYEDLREVVIGIYEGRMTPISSTTNE